MEAGTTFERAITQVPLCGPSRSSVFTGQQPSQTGVVDNSIPWFELINPADTLPAVLKDAGVHVAMFGKNFHYDPISAADQAVMFDEFSDPLRAGLGVRGPERRRPADLAVSGRAVRRRRRRPRRQQDRGGRHRLPGRAGDLDKPFFLSVGINKPHLNWWVPPEYYALYSQAEIRAALDASLADGTIIPGNGEYFDVPAMSRPSTTHAPIAADKNMWVDYIHAYMAAVSYADAKIGAVLDALEADPALAADTSILLWSDHGFHLGDKDRWEKFTLWRETTETPLIIVDPDNPGGQTANQIVNLVDIFPTVLDLMSIAKPAGIDLAGESLMPIVEDVDLSWYAPAQGRGVAFTSVYGSVSVRAHVPGIGDLRYTRYPDGKEELYNLTNDPGEHVNRLSLQTGEGLTATDEARHVLMSGLMDQQLAKAGFLVSDGVNATQGSSADEILSSTNAPGVNILQGMGGDDTYIVYRASTIIETSGGGVDTVYLPNSAFTKNFVLPQNIEIVQVVGGFTGNNQGNRIFSGNGSHSINGAGGNDMIDAGGGRDTVFGGEGLDTLVGDSGNDSLLGGSGNDSLLGGAGNDTLRGETGHDTLAGAAGNDVFTGGDGNDRINGGAGADRLSGNAGNDVFVFVTTSDSNSAGADTITDFYGAGATIGDKIDVGGIDANTGIAGNQAFGWGGTGAGRLRAVEEDGNTVVLGNTDADATMELRIVLADAAVRASSYTAADFVL